MHPLLAELAALTQRPNPDLLEVSGLGLRLKLAGFQRESDMCFNACVAQLFKYIEKGSMDAALNIENALYSQFVKSTEDEDHYHRCFSLWTSQMQEAGRKAQRPLRGDRNPRRVCFVLHTGVLLGHTEVMLRVTDSWRAQGIECEIYVAALQFTPNFEALLNQKGIKIINPAVKSMTTSLEILREELDKLDIQTAIWLSPPSVASYALAMKLAPRQVMWSVKFHPIWIPEVDIHLCGGNEIETARFYHGHSWTAAPFPLGLEPRANDPEAVKKLRSRFPSNAILLGALAREEKFNSPAFLEMVGALLVDNERAVFIWTGKKPLPLAIETFERLGVQNRCLFVGWVNTNLYAEVLDIFLETFPFGCGITGFQAMSHGTPLLSMKAMDTLYGYQLHGAVAQRYPEGDVPHEYLENLDILTAADPAHYLTLAQKLISNESYRDEIGQREKAYFNSEAAALPRHTRRLWTTITNLPA